MTKVGFVSLGCPKNLIDSEVMLGLLEQHGFEITTAQEEAEILVVNTCGFIESAKQESVDTIMEMAQQKVSGACRRLIVAGCLVERYRAEILSQIPEVDAVIGTQEIPEIIRICRETGRNAFPPRYQAREQYLYSDLDPRVLTTPKHTAYVKIAEGCDHPCSFCVIPKMRGSFRSRSLASVVAESQRLADGGVKELNLVGQDTTMYGWDHGNRQGLAELVRALGRVDGIEWVRVLYVYPNNVTDEFLGAVAETEAACKYIDIPLQHASGRVLKRMKRGGSRATLSRLIQRIRGAIPGVSVRTTMIVGFPGETDQDFEELAGFIREMSFERLGVFCYSDESDAASSQLGEKVPEEVARGRKEELLSIQQGISEGLNQALVGRVEPVLIEGVARESELLWEGRLSSQAPEIDGVVYLNDGIGPGVQPGDLRPVRITEAHPYDLVGTVLP